MENSFNTKITYKELAAYLNVSESAIKQYDSKKRELMLLGLYFKQHDLEKKKKAFHESRLNCSN